MNTAAGARLRPSSAIAVDFGGLEAADLARLHELSVRLLRDGPLEELLEDVLRAAMALLEAERGNVQRYDPERGVLEIVAQVGFEAPFLEFFREVDHETGVCGAAMVRMERIVVTDVETDPQCASMREIARASGFRAVQSTPLRGSNGHLLGMLSTHFAEPHQPTPLQLRLLDLCAQQAERLIERRRSDDALRHSEHQLRLVTGSAPVSLSHIGRDLRYRFVNEAYARRFGQPPQFFLGKRLEDVHGVAVIAAARGYIDRVLRGETFETEMDVNYQDIGLRRLRTGWVPERNKRGEVVGWVSAVTDITDRARAEAALRESEQRLKTFLAAGQMGWWECDLATGTLTCSATCRQNFGRDPQAPFTYEELVRAVHPDDFSRWQGIVEDAIARGASFAVEHRVIWPDGSVHWVASRGSVTLDAAGRATALSGMSIDITERKRTEETAQRFQFVVENSTDFVGMCDLEGRPFFVNAAALRMVGLADLEALRRVSVADFFFPEDRAFVMNEFFPRVLREGAASVEIRFRHFHTGEPLWMTYSVVTLQEQGRPIGFATISQNITERRRADARLRESEDRNRTLVESLPQLVWTCTADGRCDYLSPQWTQYTGVPVAEQLGSGWLHQVHPDDVARVGAAWSTAVRTGGNYRVEFRLRRADGGYHWFDTLAVPLRDAAGEIVKWFGTNTDIDERIRAEAQIRESRERLEAALAASRTGTFRWNIQTSALDWDDELDRLFGLHPGRTARSLSQFIEKIHPDDRARVTAACQRCASIGADFDEEFRVVWPDGSIHWLDDKGRTFFGADGKPAYMTGACVDITTHKLAEEELREARRRVEDYAAELESKVEERTASLKQAVLQMEEFSYSVSHDLRAPIRAMNQYAKLLAEDFAPQLGEQGLNYVRRIIRSSDRMNQLTLDTLALSRIARINVDIAPVSLDTIVADVLHENPALQRPRAEVDLAAPLGEVAGNASLLTQAVSNLLVNAAKFVPPGRTPRIRVWAEPHAGMVRLLIRDNGIGVPPELQHQLFGIFQRMHPGDGYEGTGIGLAIVRKAVERLGGTAGMSSDGKTGSTFWIQLQPAHA